MNKINILGENKVPENGKPFYDKLGRCVGYTVECANGTYKRYDARGNYLCSEDDEVVLEFPTFEEQFHTNFSDALEDFEYYGQ